MAKYTPTLLGQGTEVNVGQFFKGGFVDAGAAQLNQAIQNNVKVVTEAKNKKFEQAQSLRDGIVSGHFSDDMADEIGGYIEQLTDMPTYSKAYASTLASANAKLGVMVAKQAKITTEMERTTTDFDADPSSKYYDPNLSARLHDQINGDEENGIVGTGINTSSADIQNSLSDFKNNTTNIKDGVIRTELQTRLGEIVQKIEKTGGLGNVNSEFASFTTTTGGQKFVTGYTYDAKNRMYVPAFDQTKLPPMGIVELYRGIDDAAATLMDDYVNEQHKENSTPGEVLNATAKETYEQQFVLSEMKKLTPGGAIDDKTDKEFRNRPQDPSSGSGATQELQVKAEVVTNLLNNVDQLKNLDLSQLPGGTESVPFAQVDTNGDGNMTQMLDISSFQKGKYNLGRFSTEDLATGAMKDTWGYPSKTYMEIDPDSGERTLYFEGSDANGDAQYTVYNDKTADQFVQNIKGVWGSGAGGQKYYDAWQHIAKKKGVLSRDASNNKQILETGVTIKGQAAAIVKQKKAEEQAQEAGAFDAAELQTSIFNADNDNKAIDAALLPVNNFFAKTGHESKGLVDKDNKQVTERKVKYVKFDRDGNYVGRRFSKKYGVLSYRAMQDDGSYGPVQTANMKVSALISEISGGQGEFNLNQEK